MSGCGGCGGRCRNALTQWIASFWITLTFASRTFSKTRLSVWTRSDGGGIERHTDKILVRVEAIAFGAFLLLLFLIRFSLGPGPGHGEMLLRVDCSGVSGD